MKSFEFTYRDISEASGRRVELVRVDISRGELVPRNLLSLSAYVVKGALVGVKDA